MNSAAQSNKGMCFTYGGKNPKLASNVFLAPGTQIIGDVEIGNESSVWFNSVIRGDVNFVRIGDRTNIQDLSMVHVATDSYPTLIGHDVTIGHRALIHACSIGDRCLIGMGAILMDGVEVGQDCLVAAGSLVTERTKIPDGSVVMGSPARVIRQIRDKEREWIIWSSGNYKRLASEYLIELSKQEM